MNGFLAAAMLTFTAYGAVPVIFDTDMGNDVDDALALAILHTLTDRGECNLIGVTLTNASPAAVPYIHLFNRFYGRENLPVGAAIRKLPKGDLDGYLSATLKTAPAMWKKASDGKAEPAVTVLRKLLASSREKVHIVQVGFSTNLNALLDSKPDSISPLDGMALVREKVALVSAMAGNFVEDKSEFNIHTDAESARSLLERWPGSIVFSGFEIGLNLKYPARGIDQHFRYVEWHPVVESYRAYKKMPYDRPTWDLTAALYAVRPDQDYFDLSAAGKVRVTSANLTLFAEKTGGLHRYLKVTAEQRTRVLEALMLLTSEPPRRAQVAR
jgi:inosine-uridine nucleoside N-ribohydrolase